MKNIIVIFMSLLFMASSLSGQTAGDYRTRSSAWNNWTDVNVWQKYDGTSWVNVATYPTSADGAIEITANSGVWITSNITLDQLTISGRLDFNNSGGNNFFTLANSTGTDLVIGNGGSFYMLNSGRWTVNAGATWQIQNGGTYFHYSSYSCDNALNACTIDQGSTVTFGSSGGVLPSLSLSGRTFWNLKFEASSGTPSFNNITVTSPLTVNNKFTIGLNVSVSFLSIAGNNFNGDIDLYGSVSYLNSFTLAADKVITAYSNGYMTMGTGKLLTVNGQVISYYANNPINGSVTFNSGSVFQINDNVGIFPDATWNPGSLIKITGITNKTKIYLPSSPYNIIWDCPNQTSVCEISNNLTTNINGDFTLINSGSGKITNSSTANSRTVNILGNLNLQGGAYHLCSGASALTQTTNVTGNLNISGGTLDLSSSTNSTGIGNLSFKGNLNHTSGTITESGTAANKIVLNGTALQTISTSGLGGGNTINLEINNSNGISLLSDLSLYGSFIFTNGKFNLENRILTLASTSSITGYSYSNYFISNGSGTLTRKGITTETIFPIGTTINYSPVWVTNAGVADDFSANVMTDITGANGGSDRLQLRYEVHCTQSSYSNALTLKFGWMCASEGNNFKNNRSTFARMWHIEGSSWIEAGSGPYTLNTSAEPYTLSRSNINSLSPFGIGQNESALPVHLSSFSHTIKGNSVTLYWSTFSEENCAGFDIQRITENQTWQTISFIKSTGNSANAQNYSFTDRNLNSGKYLYRLKQIDYNGNFEYHNLTTIVDVAFPAKFNLSQNYPNPFNPTTKIDFDLPLDSRVKIFLYDITGRRVKTILNESRNQGYHTIQFNASDLSSGTYLYRMITISSEKYFVITKKMILLK